MEKENSAEQSTHLLSIETLAAACLEWTIFKTYVICFHTSQRQDETDLFKTLASVSSSWFSTITRRRFKLHLRRHLTIYYAQISKRRTIVRNNRLFLRETMQPTLNFIHRLQTSGCLTDEQADYIKSLTSIRDRSEEIYNLIRHFDGHWYLSFIECLRQSGQNLVAGIIERGGVTVKIKLFARTVGQLFTSSEQQRLVEHLNQLKDNTRPRGPEVEILIYQLERFDIEILKARSEKGISVWFCCHSKVGLQKLKETYFVFDIMYSLFKVWFSPKRLLRNPEPRILTMTLDQFNRTVVTCPIVPHLETRLNIARRQKQQILGVSQLENKIFALIKYTDWFSVVVYQDLYQVGKICIDDIVEPRCMVACHRTKCLYVLEGGGNSEDGPQNWSIWKINPTENQVFSWLDESALYEALEDDELQEEITSLSVSTESHMLLLKYDIHTRPELCHLDVYVADTGSSLPQRLFPPVAVRIKDPHHVIETSRGHFVISYGYRHESGISEVSRNGAIMRFFHHSEFLSEPVYLTMGSYDRVLVASRKNGHVILLDEQLNQPEILITSRGHGVEFPTHLCYCTYKKQLLVVHGCGKTIDVYSLNHTTL